MMPVTKPKPAHFARLRLILLSAFILLTLAIPASLATDQSNCIGQAKLLAPGSPVNLTGKVVTGVFPGFFYVQDTEPGHTSCGIMVKSSVVPSVRDTVTIDGLIGTDSASGEVCIDASTVEITPTAELPRAFGRTNRSVAETGINTIGVLQITWGKASSVVGGKSMLIDDGSDTPIKVVGPVSGVANGNYVRVVGIAGLEAAPTGPVNILRLRKSGDAIAMGITTHRISGRITSKTQGYAINGARVYVANVAPASSNPAYYTTTSSTGDYSVEVASGVWQVMIGAPGYLNAVNPAVDVTSADVANLNFALTPTPTMEVVKIDASSLRQGPLSSVPNIGLQGGTFTAGGPTAPVVEVVDNVPCITFNGTNYLKSDFALPVHTTGALDWTVSAWVYNPSFDAEETLFSWAGSGGADGTASKINFGNSPTVGAANHGGTFTSGWGIAQLKTGYWHHVAVTYYLNTERVYVDGLPKGSKSRALNIGFGGPAYVGSGYTFDGSTFGAETLFSGSIAQISVFDRYLDSTAVAALAATSPQYTRVMPLGDSITDGYQIPGGYRTKLWDTIQAANKHVDFVGSGTNGPISLTDKNHEGHPGWTCSQLISAIDPWMDTYKPRVVLLHICTNDIYFGADAATCISRLSTLIDKVAAKLPGNGKIYVAQIIPWGTAYPGLDTVVKQFNSQIPTLAAQKQSEGKPVYVVNMYGDESNPNGLFQADLADGVHPTQTGYNKMADIWWDAIKDEILY